MLLLLFQEGASEGPNTTSTDVTNYSLSSDTDHQGEESGSTLIGEEVNSNSSDTDDDEDDEDEDEESGETNTPLLVEMDFQQVGDSAEDEQQPDAEIKNGWWKIDPIHRSNIRRINTGIANTTRCTKHPNVKS